VVLLNIVLLVFDSWKVTNEDTEFPKDRTISSKEGEGGEEICEFKFVQRSILV
jgi:hypothetical protein